MIKDIRTQSKDLGFHSDDKGTAEVFRVER